MFTPKITQISTGKEEAAAVQANLDAHTSDTTAHITAAERNAWSSKETPMGAQNKADEALTAAKQYTYG